MINDDVMRKWITIGCPTQENYDRRLHYLKNDLLRVKLNFKGIGNRHLSLIPYSKLKRGDKFIWDRYIDQNSNDSNSHRIVVPPMIFQLVSSKNAGDDNDLGILLGIGAGTDDLMESRELVLGRTYKLSHLCEYPVILRLDSMGRYKMSDLRGSKINGI